VARREEKKREPSASSERRVLPMELDLGDRLTDGTAEREVVGHPYTTNGGKLAHVRVQRVGQPGVTEIRVCRATAYGRLTRSSGSHAARPVAYHGVRSYAVPVASPAICYGATARAVAP
jgi:hypothetical protein